MQATEIGRMAFTESKALDSEREELAIEAYRLLGYTKLLEVVSSDLVKALKKLGITPLETKDVVSYKASKEWSGMWSGHKIGVIAFASALTCTWLVSRLIMVVHTAQDWSSVKIWSIIGTVVLAACGVISLLVAGFCAFEDDAHGSRTTYRWARFSVGNYAGAIPEHVLLKALQVQKECPKASFYIDHLMKDTERMPDPFLVATCGNEEYFIDVWDEKEYERKL